ncbi:transferrin-binding protein-like solute binding protein [Novosphingobium guangzhouense]|uniref:transferrin-binding protein-like solute binding protein n=1 Tax=Novosphingobium guangzhouense TaxID=1850347 RepID=UPI001B808905|nr:transferrin-binding protein-like solute binding protein [Novosphingobium guangzhouense]
MSARATANFNANGKTNGTVANQTGTIRYDAVAGSYTLTGRGGSITFTAADIDASQSSPGATVYVRKNSSSNVDSLTITNPGVSGRFTYQYVGSAFWQHTQISNNSGSGTLDAFVYGMPSAASAVPRTGAGYFDVDLVGIETTPTGPAALGGSGGAVVDFAAGQVSIRGTMNGVYTGGDDNVFAAEGTVSSSANSFTGTFRFSDGAEFSGGLQGAFFGPEVNEIGATFNAAAPDGRVAIGTIMGRQGAYGNSRFSGRSLDNSQVFTVQARRLDFTTATGAVNSSVVGDFANQTLSSETFSIAYNAGNGFYQMTAPGLSTGVYMPLPYGSNMDYLGDLFVVPTVQTWSAAGYFQQLTGGSAGQPLRYRLDSIVYGMPTPDASLVRTGDAGYLLSFTGKVIDNDYANALLASGSGTLSVDLGSGAMTLKGDLQLVEDYSIAGRARVSKAAALTGSGMLSSSRNAFSGSLSFGEIGNYSGTFDGSFFGPGAEEVGATWSASDGSDRAVGTFLGVNDPSVLETGIKFQDLDRLTSFQTVTMADGFEEGSTITYDPTTGTYTARLAHPYGVSSGTYTFDPAHATSSSASRTYYRVETADASVTGYISKFGDQNPVIALSYMTFGDMAVEVDDSPNGSIHNFFVFGLNTKAIDRPHAGTASYSGVAYGYGSVQQLGYVGAVSGQSRLDADFGAGTLTLALNLNTSEAGPRSLPQYSFAGSIANDGFYGNTASGHFQGDFYGPNAAEFGALWSVSDATLPGGPTNISGLAVGTKR